jgi:hypothetical protein
VRAFGRHHVCSLVAALSAAVPHKANAQEAPAEVQAQTRDDDPEPDPGGLDIQYPRPRLLAMATLGGSNEYRDRLLSDRNIFSVSGGVAYMGFSASAGQSWELSTSKKAHELLVGYSYKLPLVDAHAHPPAKPMHRIGSRFHLLRCFIEILIW